jgi:hypothetical protein
MAAAFRMVDFRAASREAVANPARSCLDPFGTPQSEFLDRPATTTRSASALRSLRVTLLMPLFDDSEVGGLPRRRFADLMAEYYNQFLKLRLTDTEKRESIEYLKSL